MRWVTHLDTHQEAVELRLRQWIGAVVLDRILRGDHEERLRQRLRFSVHTDLRLIHGLEERGLRPRRRAVDFVGKHDVRKNRSGTKFKFAIFRIVDAHAKHIAGQQIRSELNALKAAMKRFGESLRKGGLAHPGNVFDEQLAAREKRDERQLDGVFLAEEGARDGALELRDDLSSSCWHWLNRFAVRLSIENAIPSCYNIDDASRHRVGLIWQPRATSSVG